MGPMAEKQTKRTVFLEGFRDGIPIALVYKLSLAVRDAIFTSWRLQYGTLLY